MSPTWSTRTTLILLGALALALAAGMLALDAALGGPTFVMCVLAVLLLGVAATTLVLVGQDDASDADAIGRPGSAHAAGILSSRRMTSSNTAST